MATRGKPAMLACFNWQLFSVEQVHAETAFIPQQLEIRERCTVELLLMATDRAY